jgi:hypothetical protein
MKPYPIAVLCSDLHLTLALPACRADKDWMAVQAHYLNQLWISDEREGKDEYLPVICAGDIFDRWNPPPELINFALQHLPDGMLCVPGQHDLPNHRIEDMYRSGYGVLKQAGRIVDLTHSIQRQGWVRPVILHGFGWGEDIQPVPRDKDGCLYVAVIHKYIWTIGHSYPGAPEEAHLAQLMPKLKGYDVAVIGDNHKGFSKKLKTGTFVFNCGGFIRRKSDELKYEPQVGILYDDGSVAAIKLNTSIDRFRTPEEMAEVFEVDMDGFVDQLEKLGEHGMDFRETVYHSLDGMDIPEPVKDLVRKALE